MNVTNDEIKYRKLHKEVYPQKVSAEQKEYVGAYDSSKITENNITDANLEKGKVRKLGIPRVVDRVVQQAIAQILTPIYEEQFSDNSFGFRPKRSAHQAMNRCKEYIDEGYIYVVDMDLEKYFDTVNQSKLIEILSRTIKDGKVISLIHKYMNAGDIVNHTFKET